MALPSNFAHLVGHWKAIHRLWLSPDEPMRESAATATVTLSAQGRFLTIAYTWADDGPQDGVLLIGNEPKSNLVTAAWIDSWHNGDRLMLCHGNLGADDILSVKGSYSAPP